MSSLAPYRKLIARLSLDAHDAPAAYRRRALWVAASLPGYVAGLYLTCVLLMLVGFATASDGLTGKLLVLAGLFMAILVSAALWVELPLPGGYPLDETEEGDGKLRRTLDKLAAKLQAPRIDEIVIDEQCAVSILAYPRWGLFGPSRHVLVIGLPWLQGLSPKQATAGIALEYARFGKRQGAVAAWFMRSRVFWPRYVAALPDEPGFFSRLVTGYFRRRWLYVQAYTLGLARELTLKTDADVAAIAGPDRTGQVMLRTAVLARWMDEFFWPELMRHADEDATPQKLPHRHMAAAFRQADRSIALRRTLKDEQTRKLPPEAPSPPLSERLAAVGQEASFVGMPEHTAAEQMLGAQLKPVIQALDEAWLEQIGPVWRKRHEDVQSARLWLANFGEPDLNDASVETLGRYAGALLTTGDRVRALPLLRRAAEHPQGTAETAWMLAQTLLEHDDVEALQYLELVMTRDVMRAAEAASMALEMSERHGKRERASAYRRLLGEAAVA